MADSRTQVLELTGYEVLLTEDKLRNDCVGIDVIELRTLLLKLGSALMVLSAGNQVGEAALDVAFTEEELWMLRGVTRFDEKTAADQQYGIKLKRKIYTALLALNSLDEFPDAEEEPAYTDVQALERLKALPKEEPHV